jgi:starvation-inducible outer membrane lipoprotein
MKSIVLFLCLALASCTSAPKAADPFDAAIAQSMGAMVGGIINVGGAQ